MSILPITNKCNQKCIFCCAEYRRNNLVSLEQILSGVKNTKNLITISGGEPTLSPDLFEIINYSKKIGKEVELQTNGVSSSYIGLARKLVFSGVNLFNINVPSHKENLSDKITKTPGFYKKRIEGIKNLEKLGANIRLTHLIHSLTYKHLSSFIDWVNKNFKSIKYIQFSFIKIFAADKKTSSPVPAYLVPRYEDVDSYLVSAFKKCRKYKINFVVDHIPLCFLDGFADHHIDFIKIKNNAKEELNHSRLEKTKMKICLTCGLNKLCFGPRRDYIEFWGGKVVLKPIMK